MGDDLRNFRRLHAVVERKLQVIRQSNHLVARDQRGERDDAAVAGCEAGTFPHLSEKLILRVFVEGWRNHLNLLASGACLRWCTAWDGEREGQSSKRKS